jgi:hypothetical protein
VNAISNQTITNLSDSGATVHRKPRHTPQRHSEWCGYYDLEDRPIYLPRLTEQQVREIAESVTVQFRQSSGLSLFCPAWDHHLCGKRGGPNDCRIIDRFGIPRLTCSHSGCEEELWKLNEYMATMVVSDFLRNQSNRLDREEMERMP